jgi:7-cyano-7-deazaguanine synthase
LTATPLVDKRRAMADPAGPVAVLCSGGLDSAVLLVEMARATRHAVPVTIEAGHAWEEAERAALGRFLAAIDDARIAPLRTLALPMGDVYGAHWSMTGVGGPQWADPDETVELRGRNLVLLAKAMVLAALSGWPTLAMGSLAGNPFPDATPEFFAELAALCSKALRAPLAIVTPFRGLHKAEVIRRGRDLPLELTLSCARPTREGVHCGDCNKCRERVEAFHAAGVADRTRYARAR